MKNLLLILVLSLFTIQSFASLCPDGSEPVKSISADGTYYVFNCSNNTNNNVTGQSESSTIGQSIYKTVTQGDPEIYQAQMLLNRFAYHIGQPNGQWTWETQSAIQQFYQESGQNFDGKWSSKILTDLQKRRLIVMPRSGPLSFAEKGEIYDEIKLNNYDITKLEKTWYHISQLKFDVVTSEEVAPPFCYPTPEDCNDNKGLYTPDPHNATVGDFNGDGLQDLAIGWIYFNHTTKREKTPSHIRFYLNDGDNNLISSPEIYALGEVPLRHFLYRMVVNDFNSDGQDDLFVGSMGVIMRVEGKERSLNDYEPNLLLLSTKDGKMEDASHLIEGQDNGGMIKDYTFSHSTTSGDINCDGFIDIYTGNALLIGDGTGSFTHQSKDLPEGKHTNAFASTIADFNGDGCGDVVMSNYKKSTRVWMSHYGKHLPRTLKELKIENYYGTGNTYVNYMTSGDLDGDGDPDLVAGISRLDPYYLGRKILVFINEEGELIEKTKTLIQDERDQDIKGKLQNHGEGTIRLVDHDRDGDLDIIDSTGGTFYEDGRFGYAVFENDGTGRFTVIPESEFVVLEDDMFEGIGFQRFRKTGAYPIDIDGMGRLDYVTFKRSPYRPESASIYGYTVLGRDKPIDMAKLVAEAADVKAKRKAKLAAKVAAAKAKRIAEEKRIAKLEAELEAELLEENKSSPLFDGRYRFNLFRYEDDEGSMKIGNGFVKIRNGEVIIEKDNRELKTGSTDLYDAFTGQINKEGKVSASMELDVLNGIDVLELYVFNGSIKDKKIWGDPPYENSLKTYLLLEAVETAVSSPLFDGRYSFNLFRYHDDEDWQELGNGFVEIRNGEATIDKDNSDLKTASTDFYDTFSGQIDEKGNVSGSVELAYLFGEDHSDVFTLSGQIDKKIWGDNPRDDFFRVYMVLVKE